MKTLFFLLILTTSLLSQQPVVLQPWMQVEGTYNGQRLGSSVGFAGKIGDSTIITASDVNGIKMYHIKTPSDTIPRFFLSGDNCSLGDFNGDGIQDLLVSGKPTKIYLGISPGEFDTTPFFVKNQEPDGYAFGRVAVGKINGDIYDDLVITDAGYPGINYFVGRAYIFWGGTVMDTIPDYIINGTHQLNGFGFRITTGDLNNDGFDDIIVRGYDQSGSMNNNDFSYIKIFLGGNIIDTIAWKYFMGTNDLGDVASFDVNGDSIDDLIWSKVDSLTKVYIHYGGSTLDSIPNIKLNNPGVANFGWKIKSAGDMNGDGFEDILVSTYQATIDGGFVFVFSGGPNIDNSFDASAGLGSLSDFGFSISSVGDINRDGTDDILVGAPRFKWNEYRGKWFILLGDTTIPVTSVRDEENNTPKDFTLFQNYPNPFNPMTVISWQSSVVSHTTIKIFDILGKEVAILVNEEKPAGTYEVTFNAGELSSGVYFYTLTLTSSEGKKQTITKKMILLSELEKKQEEEYEKQLWGIAKSGDKAAQIELAERLRNKRSPQLRKFLIDEEPMQEQALVRSNGQ